MQSQVDAASSGSPNDLPEVQNAAVELASRCPRCSWKFPPKGLLKCRGCGLQIRKALTDLERFFRRVVKTDSCWLWTGWLDKDGYGEFSIENHGHRAHRASWILHRGAIHDGLHVLHDCDNPRCVNPEHLFLGTQKDNMQDKHRKGRQQDNHGEKSPVSKLKEEQVREILRIWGARENTLRGLGKQFGVSHGAIAQTVYGHNWKHLQSSS